MEETGARSSRGCGYLPCGAIWVAADDEEMAEVHRKHEFYRRRGVATEILDSAVSDKRRTESSEGLAGGLLVPGDAVVYPPCAARFLGEEANAMERKSCWAGAWSNSAKTA